jgi:hypothetical protein
MSIRLEWKPQDAWIGAYWKQTEERWHLWICLLPCLPIHLQWTRRVEQKGQDTHV